MDVCIEALDAFLGKDDFKSVALEKEAENVWWRYQGARHYLP
jgi:hypothetical protein